MLSLSLLCALFPFNFYHCNAIDIIFSHLWYSVWYQISISFYEDLFFFSFYFFFQYILTLYFSQSHLSHLPYLSDLFPFRRKASIPGTPTTHTLHTKGRKDRNKLFWVRQASVRKRVPEAGKRIRDTSLHFYGSHKNINHNINVEDRGQTKDGSVVETSVNVTP